LGDVSNRRITEFGVRFEEFKDFEQPFSLGLNWGLFIHHACGLTVISFLLAGRRDYTPQLLLTTIQAIHVPTFVPHFTGFSQQAMQATSDAMSSLAARSFGISASVMRPTSRT